MKLKTINYLFMIMAAISLVFFGCTKDESGQDLTEDIELAEDDALVDVVFNDIFESADNAEFVIDSYIAGGGLKSAFSDTCPSITVDFPDSTRWPKVITIDFGTADCEGFYGQTRRGKIIITITGWYRVEGSSRTITLQNYYFNGMLVEGTKTIANNGKNGDGNFEFSASLENGKLTVSDSIVIERSYTRTREWVSGYDTKSRWDDIYFITGSANGVNYKGQSYTRTIMTPLEADMACRFIKSGSIDIVIGDNPTVTLDFGNGTCDSEATITKEGKTKTITLRYKHRNKKP